MTSVPESSINRPGVLAVVAAWVSVLLTGAIFGFFFAWVCSTMWGLDAADPRVAISAMQAMNSSVRNAVFFPAFFLPPVAALIAAVLAVKAGARRAALLFVIAAAVYAVGGVGLTMAVNVPMNESLAAITVPNDLAAAESIWHDYSGQWQLFNQIRAVCSGGALLLCAAAVTALGTPTDGRDV